MLAEPVTVISVRSGSDIALLKLAVNVRELELVGVVSVVIIPIGEILSIISVMELDAVLSKDL